MKFLLVAILLGGGGFFLFHQHQAAARESKELSAIASAIAGRPVTIRCQSIASAALDVSDEEGSVSFDAQGRPSDTAHLKRNTCRALARFRRDAEAGKLRCLAQPDTCSAGIRDDAQAAHVLTHESIHLRGIAVESQAECAALTTTAWTAMQLGASAPDADLVQQYARVDLYPLLPDDYRSPTCMV